MFGFSAPSYDLTHCLQKCSNFTNVDYHFYNDRLNSVSKKASYTSSNQKLVKLFYDTTKVMLSNKFGINS